MPEKYTNYPALQELVAKINQLFATKASLADYQPLIDSNHKLSKDLVSGLGTAASADTSDFATAAQGTKADAAIPNPSTKADGQLLMYDGTQQKWVAEDAPQTGVLSVTAGNDTITVGGTAANPTVAVTANKFQSPLEFTGTYSASTNKVVLADYVADAVALAANGGYEVVTVLPEPTEANYKKRMIYLYQPAGVTDYYEEYIIARSGSGTEQDPYVYTREKLGDTDIELTNYWAKADLVAITTAEVDALFE